MVDTAGHYQTRAIFFTRKKLKLYPKDPFFHYLMGMHFVLHPKPAYRPRGIKYLRAAVRLDPEMMMGWWGMGYYYLVSKGICGGQTVFNESFPLWIPVPAQ